MNRNQKQFESLKASIFHYFMTSTIGEGRTINSLRVVLGHVLIGKSEK